jgi:adenine phosphoribosyltransferase
LDQLVLDLSAPFVTAPIDYVAGIDALGFILGVAISIKLRKGFLPIRKGGKLPVAAVREEFVDYAGERKVLELRKGVIRPGDHVLVVDEWIETGAQVQAAVNLIEKEGGKVMGIVTINMDNNPTTLRLRGKYPCYSIWWNMQLRET